MANTPEMIMAQALWRQGLLVDPRTGEVFFSYEDIPLAAKSVVGDAHEEVYLDHEHQRARYIANSLMGLDRDHPAREKGYVFLGFMSLDILLTGFFASVARDKRQEVKKLDQNPIKLSELKIEARETCEKQAEMDDIALATTMIKNFHGTQKPRIDFNRTASQKEQAIALCTQQEFSSLKQEYANGFINNGNISALGAAVFAVCAGLYLRKARQNFSADQEGRDILARVKGNEECVAREAATGKNQNPAEAGMTADEYEVFRAQSNARWERYKEKVLKDMPLSNQLKASQARLRDALAAVALKAQQRLEPDYNRAQNMRDRADMIEQSLRGVPLFRLHLGGY